MKKLLIILVMAVAVICFSYRGDADKPYDHLYAAAIRDFSTNQASLSTFISTADINSESGLQQVKSKIHEARMKLKRIDFWLRYLEPITYRRINGPLPVEWETEVFEKFEAPYRREGAGLTLAELYLEEEKMDRDSLLQLIHHSEVALKVFQADSITRNLQTYHHFFLANRLFLLNLAAIYTTGFECPDTTRIIPELHYMLRQVNGIYANYNQTFPSFPLTQDYFDLYTKAVQFSEHQPEEYSNFDHFSFIKDFVNPLFKMNQQFIRQYRVVSTSFMDYSLNDAAVSIFDKALYEGQNTAGVFSLVDDETSLDEVRQLGKLLFYDPILSGNNQRSCASCHRPSMGFTDTTMATAPHFNGQDKLSRNTPSLMNSAFNHLLMMDGKHISLQAQALDVVTNSQEMGSTEKEIVDKVMSCPDYRQAFKKFLRLTPEENKTGISHITSALTLYYAKFGTFYAPFDEAMDQKAEPGLEVKQGFNLFMGKAQCGTCHFVPQFSGVKPPYVGSEFEVLGVPADTAFTRLSTDSGRYRIHPAPEMFRAFRTSTLRNTTGTKPYMHNGVFNTLEEVIDFYNEGGGAGRGLAVPNQTLSSDSLGLTSREKDLLVKFIRSLDESVALDETPEKLPASNRKELNHRKPGGQY